MTPRTILSLLAAGLLGLATALPAIAEPAKANPPAAGKEISANEIADRVQAFYDKTKTFKSKFTQRYFIKSRNKTKDSSGNVIFQKPGKMSWRYSSSGNRVVSDGKIIKVYEQENKQMYEQPMGKSQYPAALAFLVGGGNLKKSFNLSKLDANKLGFKGGYILLGEPKDPTPAYQKVLLYVDGQTYQVRRVLLLDAQGNRNRFDFEAPAVNVTVPVNEFAFIPPPGTQVIRP